MYQVRVQNLLFNSCKHFYHSPLTYSLIRSPYSIICHLILVITPFPISYVHRAIRLSPSSSDYMRFPAFTPGLACLISLYPLPALFSSSPYSQAFASSYLLLHPRLHALNIPTPVIPLHCEYRFPQIATPAQNLPDHLEARRVRSSLLDLKAFALRRRLRRIRLMLAFLRTFFSSFLGSFSPAVVTVMRI